jgi:branched-chain amino acid transport system permease protein
MPLQDIAQALISGLLIGAVYALVAVGLTLIFGVMDVVNFAHGNLLMAGMYAAFFAWLGLHLDPLASLPLVAIAVALLAGVAYQLCIRPVLKGPPLAQIIVTFGLLVLTTGLAQVLFTANTRGVTNPLVGPVRLSVAQVVIGGPQLVTAAGALLCTAAVYAFLRYTEVGAAILAVAEDPDAARLMGIDPDRVNLLTWLIAGASVGVAGGLLMNFYTVNPTAGTDFGLVAFVAVAMAGFGSIGGAVVAGLAMGCVQTLTGLVGPQYGFAAIFVLYLVVVLVRPRGLYGTR